MQRLLHTLDGAGCRTGLLLAGAGPRHYWLTCGHAFQKDEPFATSTIGETRDSAGRRVIFARLRAGSYDNEIDAALVEDAGAAGGRAVKRAAVRGASWRLNSEPVTVTQRQVPVRLGNYGFRALTLARGPLPHAGQSGSLVVTRQGSPAAILVGTLAGQLVLCELALILGWFHRNGLPNLRPLRSE